ncbi:MAG: hypothetical protein VKJ24_18210 [Synechococcales bacterium]|nr:hypothetical protein [Synechococcales bacterium]
MGKQQISQLLEQLQVNHQADLENTAAIFTVAQVAVNQLEQLTQTGVAQTGVAQIHPVQIGGERSLNALPAPIAQVSKEELKKRYGNFNACRKAAAQKGIRFHQTPTWAQLVAAFCYFDSLQSLIQSYITVYPSPQLQGVSMQFQISEQSASSARD